MRMCPRLSFQVILTWSQALLGGHVNSQVFSCFFSALSLCLSVLLLLLFCLLEQDVEQADYLNSTCALSSSRTSPTATSSRSSTTTTTHSLSMLAWTQRSCRTSRVSNPQFALPTRGETRLSHLAVMAVNSMLGFTRHELHNSSLLRVKPSRTVMVNDFEFEFFLGVLAVTSLNSTSKHNDFTVFLVV